METTIQKKEKVIEVHTTQSRKDEGIAGKDLIATSHDEQVRYTEKREQKITGYKLQLTETATEDAPAIITDIEIVDSCTYDGDALEDIHTRLGERDLLPAQHLVDRGYVSADGAEQSTRGSGTRARSHFCYGQSASRIFATRFLT